jgi:hypothetical protein
LERYFNNTLTRQGNTTESVSRLVSWKEIGGKIREPTEPRVTVARNQGQGEYGQPDQDCPVLLSHRINQFIKPYDIRKPSGDNTKRPTRWKRLINN